MWHYRKMSRYILSFRDYPRASAYWVYTCQRTFRRDIQSPQMLISKMAQWFAGKVNRPGESSLETQHICQPFYRPLLVRQPGSKADYLQSPAAHSSVGFASEPAPAGSLCHDDSLHGCHRAQKSSEAATSNV